MLSLSRPFILASGSPRRRDLIQSLGLDFTVHVSDVAEIKPDTDNHPKIVEYLALQKAEAVAKNHPDAITLGADTIVVLGNDILEKPADNEAASKMLSRLSGQTHLVYTGMAILCPETGQKILAYDSTSVTFAKLSVDEIDAYVRTGSSLDKAGGYGIQDELGAILVEKINGSYPNVIGLPVAKLYQILKHHFGAKMC